MSDRTIKISSMLMQDHGSQGAGAAAAAVPLPVPMPVRSQSHISLPPFSSFDNLINAAANAPAVPLPSMLSGPNGSTVSAAGVRPASGAITPISGAMPGPGVLHMQPQVQAQTQSRNDSISSSPSVSSFVPSRNDSNVSSLLEHGNYNTNSIPSLSTMLHGGNGLGGRPASRVTSPELSAAETSSDSLVSLMPQQGQLLHGTKQRSSSMSSTGSKSKVSKRKECPMCHKYFANLNTHKSTHLTPENRPHKCPTCHRGFSRSNDLIRHKKRHWKDKFASTDKIVSQPTDNESFIKRQISLKNEQLMSLYQIEGAYKCPYNSALIKLDGEMHPNEPVYGALPPDTYNCHPTGVFSRCDTFKNHLKALHFEYPPKTKKEDRHVVPGRCKHCHMEFRNVDAWLNDHVGKTCGYKYRQCE